MTPASVSRSTESSQPVRVPQEDGYIDFFGYLQAAESWVFCGWARQIWAQDQGPTRARAVFQSGRPSADVLTCFHARSDLVGQGQGVVLFLPAAGRAMGDFFGLEIHPPGLTDPLRLRSVRPPVHLRETELAERTRALLHIGTGTDRPRMLGLMSRNVFQGVDTLDQLPVPVMFEVDETVLAPPDGLVAIGWCLDPTGSVASIRLRSGSVASPPIEKRWLRVSRPDVLETVGSRYGLTDARCGFVAFAPDCLTPGEAAYAEVELRDGQVGYKRLPAPLRTGLPAMRRILESVQLTRDEVERAFDEVLGAPLRAINAARLSRPRPRREIAFGESNPRPACSIIVPLYGRMDFVMYQQALLSQADMAQHEILYVLDDPPRKQELLTLAHSVHARFGLPFRVIALEENLGFAPANNVGLECARGEHVCFLNSDVMPDEPRWLELMLETLHADPGIGIVGALLLFEDGTIQHEGMTFEPLPEWGGWPFPMHPNKGRWPAADAPSVTEAEAVTGACMLLRTGLARELGGFDEAYAIGDFEDSDLCFRVSEKGLRCAVDRRARLWHLERQSQITPDRLWRFHATLQNAWVHTRRWSSGAISRKHLYKKEISQKNQTHFQHNDLQNNGIRE